MTDELSPAEREEMTALYAAISTHPASVHPDKMERFSELFVRTLPRVEEDSAVQNKL